MLGRTSIGKLMAGALASIILCVAPPVQAQEIKKVPRSEALAAAISKVNPDYPPMARQLKLEGSVEIAIVIDTTGKVEKTDAVNGNPVLTRPAADALKKWKFKPFLSDDGKPVRAESTILITFKL